MTPAASHPHTPPGWMARLRQAWGVLRGQALATPAPAASAASAADTPAPPAINPTGMATPQTHPSPSEARAIQPYNPQALPLAKAQWQNGDWPSLARLTLDELQDHPDRAKLALLAAAGLLQLGQNDTGTNYLRQAKDWGCSPLLLRQVVIAGVHNSLGKAAALAQMPARAEQHFASALHTVMPLANTKAREQRTQITDMQAYAHHPSK